MRKKASSGINMRSGFTLVETLFVIMIIGLLAAIVIVNVRSAVESARYARAEQDLRTIDHAARMYFQEYNEFPEDAEAGEIPEGLDEFLRDDNWPTEPWPESFYDWNHWKAEDLADLPPEEEDYEDVVQISVRFCPEEGAIEDCVFPRADWAESFDVNSAVYRCIKGPCRAHKDELEDYPSHCINC